MGAGLDEELGHMLTDLDGPNAAAVGYKFSMHPQL
jgi:hypothetical protein